MTLQFPNPPTPNNMVVVGNQIEREWTYNFKKERWELSGFDSLAFKAESPIVQDAKSGDIVTDFDIQDLENV